VAPSFWFDTGSLPSHASVGCCNNQPCGARCSGLFRGKAYSRLNKAIRLTKLQDIEKKTDEIVAADKAQPPTDASSNIISQMLQSPDLASSDKSRYRLALEARTLVGAGTETTGNSLSVTTFHLLANPDKARRLKEEIQLAQSKSKTPLKYQDLQKLPYLV
jgi:cytochrome P450